MIADNKQARQERAKRVSYVLRQLLGLKRSAFSRTTGISWNTLRNWEKGLSQGMGEAGAHRLVTAFRDHGVDCSLEWIMYGIGEAPSLSATLYEANTPYFLEQQERKSIQEEAAFFCRHHKNSIHTSVIDDGMLPFLWMDDHVAGVLYQGNDINKIVGLSCIAETIDGQKWTRNIEMGSIPGHYTLICMNKRSLQAKDMENVRLKWAAPILWIRKPSYKLIPY